jgi:hypothetical protein
MTPEEYASAMFEERLERAKKFVMTLPPLPPNVNKMEFVMSYDDGLTLHLEMPPRVAVAGVVKAPVEASIPIPAVSIKFVISSVVIVLMLIGTMLMIWSVFYDGYHASVIPFVWLVVAWVMQLFAVLRGRGIAQ